MANSHLLYSRALRTQQARSDFRTVRRAISGELGPEEQLETTIALGESVKLAFLRNNPDPSEWTAEQHEGWRRLNSETRLSIDALSRLRSELAAQSTSTASPTVTFTIPTAGVASVVAVRRIDGQIGEAIHLSDGRTLLRDGDIWREAREQQVTEDAKAFAFVVPTPSLPEESP